MDNNISATTFDMTLHSGPFQAIASGRKTVEMRLNDERRQNLRVGDFIRFENKDTHETILCEVLELAHFPSFKELYEAYTPIEIGYLEGEEVHYEDMYLYYPRERIETYGALAIRLRRA